MSIAKWKIGAVAALFTLGMACTGCDRGKEPKTSGSGTPVPAGSTPVPSATNANLPGQAAVAVAVHTVGQKEVTLEQTYTATILAAKQVEVKSQVEGNLENFTFREGSRVSAGQVLFSIDRRALEAQLKSAQAKVLEARANLQLAQKKVNWKKAQADQAEAEANLANEQREVDRYKPLMERSIIPRQLYDQTVSARDVAKAQLDSAKAGVENTAIRDTASISSAEADLAGAEAAVDNAQVSLSYTTISAPISGTIGQLAVYPGNLVTPGTDVLVTISSTDPIYVEFAISEAEYLAVARRAEQSGKSQSDRIYQLFLADGKEYDHLGKFSMIARAVDANTGTIAVRLEFPNPAGTLRPGEFANVKLNTEDIPDAMLVPQRAVQALQSSNFVFVVNSKNEVEQREIVLGSRVQNSVVVKSGLKDGERVVVDGMARLKPGMTVSVQEVK